MWSLFCEYYCFFSSFNLCLVQGAKAARLEKFEIPVKIKLLAEAWTPESGLVTAALKLKRDVVSKAFSHELAQLYSS